MMIPTLALALTFALAGESSAPAKGASDAPASPAAGPAKATAEVSAAPAAAPEREPDQPPPGSKADQALWQAAHDVNTQLVAEQHVAAKLTHGARRSEFQQKLQELAKSGALPQARADELSAKLMQKWTANLDIVRRQWPVGKLRVCGYELLNFEALMDPPGKNPVQVEETREELTECVGRANKVLRPLRKSNQELQAVLTEIDKELAPLLPKPAVAPPPKQAAPASTPAPEAAAVAAAGRRGTAPPTTAAAPAANTPAPTAAPAKPK